MKILIAGDIHGGYTHLKYLFRTAVREGAHRIFQLGDFGYWEHQEDGVQFLDRASAWATGYDVGLYFLDGNHDKTSLLLEKYQERDSEGFIKVRRRVKYAPRGHRWTWDYTRFAAFGGAYSTDKDWRVAEEKKRNRPGWLWFPEEEMTDEDMAKFLLDESPVDVLLAHDKPRASNPMWNRKDLPLCLPNQDRLQMAATTLQPHLFVHGHLHYRYTDHIRVGDDKHCEVVGLHCDRDAALATGARDYSREDSWMILETTTVDFGTLEAA